MIQVDEKETIKAPQCQADCAGAAPLTEDSEEGNSGWWSSRVSFDPWQAMPGDGSIQEHHRGLAQGGPEPPAQETAPHRSPHLRQAGC